jgi:hypothetical protein
MAVILAELDLRGRNADIVPVDGCLGARHSYRYLVMLNILAQAKFLREAQWANEVPL